MSRIRQALHNDVQAIAFMRDELKLQARLFKGETLDRWHQLEQNWDALREHVQRAKVAAEAAKPEIEAAAELLVDTLKRGYASFNGALAVNH